MSEDTAGGVLPSSHLAEGMIRLWDGRLYSRDALARKYPALAAVAQECDTLRETVPYSAVAIGLRQAVLYSVGFYGLLVFGVGAFWLAGGIPNNAPSLLDGIALLAIPILVFSALAGIAFHWNRYTVSVRDGEVQVSVRRQRISVLLTDCQWYIGSVQHTTCFRKLCLPNDQVVILAFSKESNETPLVAVGFSDKSRAIWETFLTTADVPRRTLPDKQASLWTLFVACLTGVVLLGLYGVVFYYLSSLVAAAVLFLTRNPDMAVILRGIVAFLGTLTAWVYTMRQWPSRGIVTTPTQRSASKQRSTARKLTLRITLLTGMIGSSILLGLPQRNITARLAGTIVWVLWVWIVTRDMVRRELALDHDLSRPATRDDHSPSSERSEQVRQ